MRTSHARQGTALRRSARSHAVRAAAAAVVVSALALTTAGTAQAAPASQDLPGFLEAEDLPPHSSSDWHAGDITKGLPDIVPFCTGDTELPTEGASHRTFRTDLDTSAKQVSFVTDGAETAKQLAAELRESTANCAADWLRDNPGGTASWRDLGNQDVGDGAHSYGVYIESDYGSQDIHLFGVGVDGDTVTVVHWGQMGTFDNAPVAEYRTTLKTAVEKLVG